MLKIGEGETSEVYRVSDEKVVKLFKAAMYDPEDFLLEYNTAKHIGNTTDFAPKVYEQINIQARHGYVMDEIYGCLFQDEIDNKPEKLSQYASQLGIAHKKLHETEITDELCELSSCNGFLRSFPNRNTVFSKDVSAWLIELLDSLPTKQSLLHGDFMPYNIMYQNGELKILDWAEPSLGSTILDVARTVNFIVDSTDYPNSIITENSDQFVESYLSGYYGNNKIEKDDLHKGLLVNAAAEVAWAERSNQSDSYSEYLKSFITNNYESKNSEYMTSLSRL